MAFIFPLNAGKYSEKQYFTASSTALVEPGLSFVDELGVTWKYVQADEALIVPARTEQQKWSFLPVSAHDEMNSTGTDEFRFPFTKVVNVSTSTGTHLVCGFILNPGAVDEEGDSTTYTVPANNFIMMLAHPTLHTVS